ncbi:hypothetical protein D915_003357 [Fasciola hepatica]|uniref:Uncharacterized protein n=1 Tax=Fasciola hepatica TaxID=6192 RepID=A0A4E0RE27_FASHE|nr:hypothetical protein D915_003357 [Fasciola hepatica]
MHMRDTRSRDQRNRLRQSRCIFYRITAFENSFVSAPQEITISGKRVRYVSLPDTLDVHKTLHEWDFDFTSAPSALPLAKRMLHRPKRTTDKYAYLRERIRADHPPTDSGTVSPGGQHDSAAAGSEKGVKQFPLSKEDVRPFSAEHKEILA